MLTPTLRKRRRSCTSQRTESAHVRIRAHGRSRLTSHPSLPRAPRGHRARERGADRPAPRPRRARARPRRARRRLRLGPAARRLRAARPPISLSSGGALTISAPLTAVELGFSLHAATTVDADDEPGREADAARARLCQPLCPHESSRRRLVPARHPLSDLHAGGRPRVCEYDHGTWCGAIPPQPPA
jgi:hypothetical protein